MTPQILKKFKKDLKNRITNYNPFQASASDRRLKIPKDIQSISSIYQAVSKCTMTSPERVHALISAVQYIVDNNIPGAFVESGVWRGGSSMVAALALLERDVRDRPFWLYDTYEGMVKPSERDGSEASNLWQEVDQAGKQWCAASMEDVRHNMASTGYPLEHVQLIRGNVCNTIPQEHPDQISLLRLDTDWYESTKVEMETLFPRVVSRGVVIIDDYGRWEGSQQAVDEYLATLPESYLLQRIDGSARMLIKH